MSRSDNIDAKVQEYGPHVIWIIFLGCIISWSLGFYLPIYCVALPLLVFAIILHADSEDREQQAWETYYAGMTDTAKINYHLDRARRYGTNYDANIAQALIERNKK